MLREWFGRRFPIVVASARRRGRGWTRWRSAAYDLLGVIRIYTKIPGKPADSRPPVHRAGREHGAGPRPRGPSRPGADPKFAKVWGTGVFEGQTVKRDHELHDGDVVELHA